MLPPINAHPILSSDPCGVTRMKPYDPVTGLTLEAWTMQGMYELTLLPAAVLALVRALPLTVIAAALEAHDSRLFPMCHCTAVVGEHIALSGTCGAPWKDA